VDQLDQILYSPPVLVELITKYQIILITIKSRPRQSGARRITIDQGNKVRYQRDLSGRINPSEIIRSICGLPHTSVEGYDWVSREQGQEDKDDDEETADVDQSSHCEDRAAVVELE
jgi:hypothetical protein